MSNTSIKLCSEFPITDRVKTETRLRDLQAEVAMFYKGERDARPMWMWATPAEEAWAQTFNQIDIVSNGDRVFLEFAADGGVDFNACGCILRELIWLEPEDTMWTIPYVRVSDRLVSGEFYGGVMVVTRDKFGDRDTESLALDILQLYGKHIFTDLITRPLARSQGKGILLITTIDFMEGLNVPTNKEIDCIFSEESVNRTVETHKSINPMAPYLSQIDPSQEKPIPHETDNQHDDYLEGIKDFFRKENIKTLSVRIAPVHNMPNTIAISSIGNNGAGVAPEILHEMWKYFEVIGELPHRLFDHPGETEWVLDCVTMKLSPDKDRSIMENLNTKQV